MSTVVTKFCVFSCIFIYIGEILRQLNYFWKLFLYISVHFLHKTLIKAFYFHFINSYCPSTPLTNASLCEMSLASMFVVFL